MEEDEEIELELYVDDIYEKDLEYLEANIAIIKDNHFEAEILTEDGAFFEGKILESQGGFIKVQLTTKDPFQLKFKILTIAKIEELGWGVDSVSMLNSTIKIPDKGSSDASS